MVRALFKNNPQYIVKTPYITSGTKETGDIYTKIHNQQQTKVLLFLVRAGLVITQCGFLSLSFVRLIYMINRANFVFVFL